MSAHCIQWEDSQYVGVTCSRDPKNRIFTIRIGQPTRCEICGGILTLRWEVWVEES